MKLWINLSMPKYVIDGVVEGVREIEVEEGGGEEIDGVVEGFAESHMGECGGQFVYGLVEVKTEGEVCEGDG